MKKFLFVFIAVSVLMTPSLFAAGSQDSGDGPEIVVVPKDSSNPWFVRMEEGVDEYAAETGLNLYQRGTAEIDATLQAQLVQDLIAQGVDAICVVPVDVVSIEPVLAQARDAGIVVISHEGAALKNVDYNIEAFSNAGYGAFIMDNLAEAMGEEGVYTTMVASLTVGAHNEWADAGVAHQKATYPNMQLLEAQPRVESQDNGDVAYNTAMELFNAYPELKGIMGTSSYDAPGVARAIEELGLVGKAFTSGTGLPLDNAELLESGIVQSLTLWDPAVAGKAMASLAVKVLNGEKISEPVDLGIAGYDAMTFREAGSKTLEGEGWIVINADNVYDFGF
ncbi:MAG: autoinducer 2 ABC transporter substrate-binding protein [Spirochaetaceae bacterium]|nr:autoinducer 2 ABC transporter substrate-binding protein [Spirochaetaceae bacterium]